MNKYYIVEFEDGLQIVPNNWFTCEKKLAVHWPNLTNQKEYDKAVEKMKDFRNDNTTIISVKRIFGNTSTFVKAKDKLKLAEKLSDLNSDEDAEVIKKRRRLYAAKVYSSSSSEEEIQNPNKKKKIDNYPKPPQITKNSKLHRTENKENSPSEQENEIENIRFQRNYEFSSNIHHVKDSQNVFQQASDKNISVQPGSDVQHDIFLSKFIQGFNEFKHQVYKSFSVLKQKSNLILQNQTDFQEQQNNNAAHIPVEDEINIMSQFPIDCDDTLNQLEEALIDQNYRNKVVAKLTIIGGKNLRQLILNIMKKIFTLTVAKNYSWHGKKNNKSFSDLKLCSVIISAVQIKYPQATEYEISEPIKSWLRHASEKIQKRNAANA